MHYGFLDSGVEVDVGLLMSWPSSTAFSWLLSIALFSLNLLFACYVAGCGGVDSRVEMEGGRSKNVRGWVPAVEVTAVGDGVDNGESSGWLGKYDSDSVDFGSSEGEV